MFNLEAADWNFIINVVLIVIGVAIVLKMAYFIKPYVALPPSKPMVCWLPKFELEVPINSNDVEAEFCARLTQLGFREARRKGDLLVFSRGSALGEFSIKIAKLIATTTFPITSPVVLQVGYGAPVGVLFDTGDLWKFCRELMEKNNLLDEQRGLEGKETGNPYRPPMNQ